MAIQQSPNKMLMFSEIYQFIMDSFPHYFYGSNTIRHNLSLTKCFVPVCCFTDRPKNYKDRYWTLNPGCENMRFENHDCCIRPVMPFREDKNLNLSQFFKEDKKPNLSQFFKEDKKPNLSQFFKEDKKPNLSQSFKEDKKPNLSQFFKEDDKPNLSQSFKEDKKPNLSQFFKEDDKPNLSQSFKEDKKPNLSQFFKEDKKPNLSHLVKPGGYVPGVPKVYKAVKSSQLHPFLLRRTTVGSHLTSIIHLRSKISVADHEMEFRGYNGMHFNPYHPTALSTPVSAMSSFGLAKTALDPPSLMTNEANLNAYCPCGYINTSSSCSLSGYP
jgi:dsDNA-binding SOS-regulon protein